MTDTILDHLLDLDAVTLGTLIREGRASSEDVTRAYLRRIETHNADVNAVLEVNPRALDEARELDRELRERGPRSPLHGLPVLLKDNIDTAGPLHTTAGAWNLRDHTPERDAPLVTQLREAGAVILGKANMSEWAYFMTIGLGMPSGFSSHGGQVRNPWKDGLDCGGSSSGSGAAIAARLAPLTVGTETSGSILSPASANGAVGLKPTVGRVSRTGIIPISHSQDTAGPITRTCRDAALLLAAIGAPDPADDATSAAPPFDATLDADALRGARLGVATKVWARLPQARRDVLEAALDRLREAGAEVIDADLDTHDDLAKSGIEVLLYEFRHTLDRYLATVRNGPKTLREVIEQNEANPERTPHGQLLLLAAQATSGTLQEAAYTRARARDLDLARERGLNALFERERLDAWLTPDNWAAHVGAKAGYPSLTVPTGTAEGAPVGLTFTGLAWTEQRLLSLGAAYEALRGPWQPAP